MSRWQRGHNVCKRNAPRVQKKPPKPYEPSMRSYGSENITAFIDQCKEWDETREIHYQLDTGEEIQEKEFYKYFDSKKHYIQLTQYWLGDIVVQQYMSRRHDNSSFGSSYGVDDEKYDDLMDRIRDHRNRMRRTEECMPVLEKVFSEGHHFSTNVSDEAISVEITDNVSFGDFKDAQKNESQNRPVTGTITGYINTVRPFMPGKYRVTVISEEADKGGNFVIFHHVDIDPSKLVYQIYCMADDYDGFHRDMRNSINRYDWCHWRNWGSCDDEESQDDYDNSGSDSDDFDFESDCLCHTYNPVGRMNVIEYSDEYLHVLFMKSCENVQPEMKKKKRVPTASLSRKKQVIYFCATEEANSLKDCVEGMQPQTSSTIPGLNVIKNEEKCIALAMDMDPHFEGDWLYAKLFQDRNSSRYFALAVNTALGYVFEGSIPQKVKEMFPTQHFTSVKETGLVFDMAEFLN